MPRENDIRIRYGTRAQVDAAAAAAGLLKGEPFLIDDEGRIGVATGTTTYVAFAKQSEAGGGLSGSAVITVPNVPGKMEWEEAIAAPGVTAASRIFLSLGATSSDDENEVEDIAVLGLAGIPSANSIWVEVSFAEFTSGPIKLNWSAL